MVSGLGKLCCVAIAGLALFLALFLSGCGGDGIPNLPPHESWKDRSEYCYSIVVDPRGESNTMVGYSDDVTLVVTDAGYVVQAVDMRVYPQECCGHDDYYMPAITWATDGDGFADIQGCRPVPVDIR